MEKLKYPKKTLIFTLEMPMKTLLFYSCFTVATLIINNIFAAICEMALVFAIRSLPLNSIKGKSTDHKMVIESNGILSFTYKNIHLLTYIFGIGEKTNFVLSIQNKKRKKLECFCDK